MTVRYPATFEFDARPPLTHRGTVTGGKSWTLVARATRDAHRALKPINWASLNVVLLERLIDEAETSDDEGEDDDAAEPAQES